MDETTIAKLLEPFLAEPLAPSQLNNILTYINILLRWNARMNLTAIRNPEEIVTRHFGESLFAGRHLASTLKEIPRLIDVGSGAGFPGLPVKIFSPDISLTLIESNHKKVAFLREVIRALDLRDANVFSGRAEDFVPLSSSNVVTLRAVESFSGILPIADRLAGSGSLVLLIGNDQVEEARSTLPRFGWGMPIQMPMSSSRAIITGVGGKL
jgi:16S rRNA (guanine527-N7)-methyltransferase